MYIGKRIYIEGIAKFKHCKAALFPGHNWSESWDQMDTSNKWFNWNNAGRSATILH